MVQYLSFVDDSGNDPNEEWFVLAGWVGEFNEWADFSDEWDACLKEHPSINYFKHSESIGRRGCFDKFTVEQIDNKGKSLVKVLTSHKNLTPYSVVVKHSIYKDSFVEPIRAKGRRKLAGRIENQALYLAFHNIIPLILQRHFDKKLEGEIDFIFDDGKKPSKAARRCIEWYTAIKDDQRNTNGDFYPFMGKAGTGEDREALPLQAADFLAGQVRLSMRHNGFMFPPLRDMLDGRRMGYIELNEQMLSTIYPPLFRG